MDKDILNILNKLPHTVTDFYLDNKDKNITEIRIRQNSNICACCNGQNIHINNSFVNSIDLQNIFFELCNKSVYAFENQISQGFITLNGHRIGIAGNFIVNDNDSKTLQQVTSVNIRLSKHIDIAINDEVMGFKTGLLICGKPHSGKTTFIRRLCSRLNGKNYTVCDERNEIFTDTLTGDFISGMPKHIAILQAVRTMNPEYIICDEIGSRAEAEKILSAMHTGVKFICSVHCDNLKDLYLKPNIKLLLDNYVFDKAILLENNNNSFYVKEVKDV